MRSDLIVVDGTGYAPIVLESIHFNQSKLRDSPVGCEGHYNFKTSEDVVVLIKNRWKQNYSTIAILFMLGFT